MDHRSFSIAEPTKIFVQEYTSCGTQQYFGKEKLAEEKRNHGVSVRHK